MLGVYMHEACSYDCETIGEEEVLQADKSLTYEKENTNVSLVIHLERS